MTKVPGVLAEPSTKPRSCNTVRMPASIWGLPHSMARSCSASIGQADILEQLARGDEVVDAAAIAERLARHGRIVDELPADVVADEFVVAAILGDALAIGQLGNMPAAMHQHHVLEALVRFGVADDAQERREPGAGAEQIEVRPGSRLSTTSVPVGLRPTRTGSSTLTCCRREVSGPSGTLIE